MKRVVFDLDDTISVHHNRDYANAEPVFPVIVQMRALRNRLPEVKIAIHTARGQASCNGDSKLAEERNRPIIEEWLARYGVPYDEIIFGKPLADAYVDDKAISVEEFVRYGAMKLGGGFSGASVSRIGRIVVKRCDDAQRVADWYRKVGALPIQSCAFPFPLCSQLGKVYLRYEDGKQLSSLTVEQLMEGRWMSRVAYAIREFAGYTEYGENDVAKYCDYIRTKGVEFGVNTDAVCKRLTDGADLLKRKTVCHGDFSTMNLIVRLDGSLCAIDAHEERWICNYLTDAAKFCACLDGLDCIIAESCDKSELKPLFLSHFTEAERRVILALEVGLILRVAPYAKKKGDDALLKRIVELAGGILP